MTRKSTCAHTRSQAEPITPCCMRCARVDPPAPCAPVPCLPCLIGMVPVRPPSRIACGPGRAVVCTEYGQAAHGIALPTCNTATYNPTHVLCGASCDAKGGALAYAVIRASRAELDVAVRSACGLPVARGRAVRLAQKGMSCHTGRAFVAERSDEDDAR